MVPKKLPVSVSKIFGTRKSIGIGMFININAFPLEPPPPRERISTAPSHIAIESGAGI